MRNSLMITTLLLSIYGTAVAQNFTIQVDTLTREYLLHLPTLYTPTETYPLVINMHGAGSNAAQQELYSQFNSTSNLNDFILVYPEGIYNIWNAGFSGYSDSLFDDVGFISTLIDTLSEAYPIDLNRVYACGMSMGGFMSYRLACELDDRIAAIASVTGSMTDTLYNNCNPDRNVPVLEIHGTLDSTVLYNGDTGVVAIPDVIEFWAQYHNCPTNPVVENLPDNFNEGSNIIAHTYAPCDLSSEVILYEVVNGGHTWPGAFFNITSAGITNRDIKAQDAIWEFFSRHKLDNPPTGIETSLAAGSSKVEIYPNPATGLLHISLQGGIQGTFEIRDLLGNLAMEESTDGLSASQIDISSLQSGVYLLTFQMEGRSHTQKLIISK